MDQRDTQPSGPIEQILIDFQGGTHGNFLEFLLNKFYYRTDWNSPFTLYGTSHVKHYDNLETRFYANHFTKTDYWKRDLEIFYRNNNVILITVEPDDLLLLQCVSLLRSGDYNIEQDQLEVDTYNKLNNRSYHSMLENIQKSYNIVITAEEPNVSRHILREFFKWGFKTPEVNGFIQTMAEARNQLVDKNVYEMPFSAFYNLTQLKNHLTNIDKYFKIDLCIVESEVDRLHAGFLSKIPYLNVKKQCDEIVQAIVDRQFVDIPKLSLMQESYVSARVEVLLNKKMPFIVDTYYTNTREIIDL